MYWFTFLWTESVLAVTERYIIIIHFLHKNQPVTTFIQISHSVSQFGHHKETVKKQLMSAAHTNVFQLHKIWMAEGLYELLAALAKMLKATRSFVMPVRLSLLMTQFGTHWTYLHEIWYLRYFRKSVNKIPVPLKSVKLNNTLNAVEYIFFIISRLFLIRIRNVSNESFIDNQIIHFCVQ